MAEKISFFSFFFYFKSLLSIFINEILKSVVINVGVIRENLFLKIILYCIIIHNQNIYDVLTNKFLKELNNKNLNKQTLKVSFFKI